MRSYLIGGGWTEAARPLVYGPFLQAAGTKPTIACVMLGEGDGRREFERWATVLEAVASCDPTPVLVAEGQTLDVAALGGADGVLVCGGLTPAYAAAIAPVAAEFVAWLRAFDRPYAGFSAGAAIASIAALVGGWKVDGVTVCSEDASEDLDQVTVVAGLGLAPFTVDVHAAQWGTLPRLIAAVRSGAVETGVAIDEDTMVEIGGDGTIRVAGLGLVHHVRASEGAVLVQAWSPGDTIN